MSLITRFLDKWTQRAFVPGQGMSEPVFMWDVAPEEDRRAADYLRLSNAVYVCNKLRAQNLSGLPLVAYRQRNGRRDEVTQGDLVELLQKVNPFWTWQRLIEMTEMSLGVWGDAYWFMDRGSVNGRRGRVPKEIWWARSDRVRPVKSTTEYISHFELLQESGQEPIRFERDEVIWFRYPNPADEWSGLSPLAAAALAADAGRSAAKSNSTLFRSGIQMAGIIAPAGGPTSSFTEEQAHQIEQAVNRRFRDPRNANKWGVFRQQIEFKPLSISPKDAEFLGTLSWSLEEVCRAYGVPIDLVGGQRTYENYNAAQLDLWYRTLLPEARFIANELTEQLLPMFPGQADLIEFNHADVPVLQDAERAKWSIDKEQIASGVMTINKYLDDQGQDPVPWGDVWWAPIGLTPVSDATDPLAGMLETPPSEVEVIEDPEPRILTAGRTRSMEYGSNEHRAFMERAEQRQKPGAAKIGKTTADLMKRQRQSILAQLRQRSHKRDEAELADDPFDLPRWIRTFAGEMRPVLRDVIRDAGQQSLDDLGVSINFDLFDPNVINALEKQVQRFAREVNETTWNNLKASLGEGMKQGETVDELAERVNDVMGDRIQSSGETIARTESNTAHSTADLMGWQQSGVVGGKEWLSALDDRTRSSHVEAHEQVVKLDDNFIVGGHRKQGPGLGGPASEDVNCRCAMVPVLDIDMEDA